MRVDFTETGWGDYLFWQQQDKKTLKRINRLIADIGRVASGGIGKPEALRGEFTGWYSRRIDDSNRLVYRLVDDDVVQILQCRGHYGDK